MDITTLQEQVKEISDRIVSTAQSMQASPLACADLIGAIYSVWMSVGLRILDLTEKMRWKEKTPSLN